MTAPIKIPNPVKVRGVCFHTEGKAALRYRTPGDAVVLVREPSEPHDPNAIRVLVSDATSPDQGLVNLGYIPKDLSAVWAPLMDSGKLNLRAKLHSIENLGGRIPLIHIYVNKTKFKTFS